LNPTPVDFTQARYDFQEFIEGRKMTDHRAGIAAVVLVVTLACACSLTPDEARARIDALEMPFDEIGIGNAVLSSDTKRIKLFALAGYDLNAFDEANRAPLMLSARLPHLPTMKALITAGARAEELPGVLILPTMRGDVKAMSMLLDAGAVIDSVDSSGRTALLGAIGRQQLEAIRFLLDSGANPEGNPPHGGLRRVPTPLIEAIQSGRPEIVELLIESGAGTDTVGGVPLMTPLIAAARQNHTLAVDLLLAAGADPKKRAAGIDSIRAAERAGHKDLAQRLREASTR